MTKKFHIHVSKGPKFDFFISFLVECNENGDIIILGLSERSEIKLIDVRDDNGTLSVQNCSIKANRYGHAIINSSCTDLQIKVSIFFFPT